MKVVVAASVILCWFALFIPLVPEGVQSPHSKGIANSPKQRTALGSCVGSRGKLLIKLV